MQTVGSGHDNGNEEGKFERFRGGQSMGLLAGLMWMAGKEELRKTPKFMDWM